MKRVSYLLIILFLASVSQFAQWYRQDSRTMLDAEQLDLWIGLDFVLSFVYRLDEPGYPVRPTLRAWFGDEIPPLTLQSPHPNAPYIPAKTLKMLPEGVRNTLHPYSSYYPEDQIGKIQPFEVRVFRPMGGNYGTPLPGRTFRGIPKTFHNIGIQSNAPTTPYYFVSGLSTLFLGRGVSNFSLGLMDPVIAARLPNMILGTVTSVLVFLFARFVTGSTVIGLAAALFQALEPMSLAESRTNKTDTSIAALVFLTMAAYFFGQELQKRTWRIWAGLFFGLALLTKVQAAVVPFVLLGWKVSLGWLRDDLSKLNRLRVLALIGLIFALSVGGTSVWLFRYIPGEVRLRIGGVTGFVVTVILSLAVVAAILIWMLLPLKKTFEEVARFVRSAQRWLEERRHLTAWRPNFPVDRLDLLCLAIAALVFVAGFPNIWGDPARGFFQHWFGFYGGINPLRPWFFVTETVYLPVYYYLLMVPLHANPLYLVSLVAGFWAVVRILRRESLGQSRQARGLALILAWLIGYGLLTAAGGAYKKMQIAISFYPWLSMIAGIGLVQLIETAWSLLFRWGVGRGLLFPSPVQMGLISALVIMVFMLPPVLTYAPYYYLYVSPLLGNPNNLGKLDWVASDSVTGYERVADYVHATSKPDAKVAAVGGVYNLSFFHENTLYGDVMGPEDLKATACDYVAIHTQDKQRSPNFPLVRFFADKPPVHTVTINGIDVIWVYECPRSSNGRLQPR